MAEKRWFYAKGTKVFGPWRKEDLGTLITKGTISQTDLVWVQGDANWIPAADAMANCEHLFCGQASISSDETTQRAPNGQGEGESGSKLTPPPLPPAIGGVEQPSGAGRNLAMPKRRTGIRLLVVSAALVMAVFASRVLWSGRAAVKITGVVTRDGQPVTGGVVVLTNSKTSVSHSARITETGSYEFVASSRAGVRDGEYAVSILPAMRPITMGEMVSTDDVRTLELDSVPEKYRNPDTSGLRLTITTAGERRRDFQMVSDKESAGTQKKSTGGTR